MKTPTEPIIVTGRELQKLIPPPRAGGMESLDDGAQTDAVRQMKDAISRLREAEAQLGSNQVMVTAQDATVSLLQSAIAEGAISPARLEPLPAGGFEAKFDEQDWAGWATVAWSKITHLRPHALDKPKREDAIPFSDEGRIGLLGDWGTGLYGAPVIAQTIEKESDPYSMLLHLGDVYYSGSNKEVQERFVNAWPKRREATTMRALNGNHEMYSGGYAYFDQVLPGFSQDASYFACQNTDWTLIGLDLAHNDHAINEPDYPNQQLDWLKGILQKAGERKVILFSHHQLFSHYEVQGDKLWADPEFAAILRSKKIFAWYWGHEHRCCIYEEPDPRSGILARCIGHGGMPQSRDKTRALPAAPEHEKADWRRAPAARDAHGNTIPQALVLEGRNPYLGDEADKFTPHGFATLIFEGQRLTEQVRDCEGNVIYQKILTP